MPIYEYQCEQCGHQADVLQKVFDPPISICPACKRAHFKKLVSASSFCLKGTGWYQTDFKDKPKVSSSKSDSTPVSSTTKPEEKAAAPSKACVNEG